MSSLPPLTRRNFLKAAAVLGAGLLAPGLTPRRVGAAGTPRIVVVGAGPTGLVLSILLGQQGHRVVVLEREASLRP